MTDEKTFKKSQLAEVIGQPNKVNGVWIADIHTLHPRTPTSHILGNMSTMFYKDIDLSKVNLVIFGGDVFHQLANNTKDPDFLKIMEWFNEFFSRCVLYNTSVYILEGTSSHDWGQAKHLDIWKPAGATIRYIDKVEVVRDHNLGLDILFVPDNMATISTDEIWNMVVKAMSEAGVEMVDITALHGAFDYQLPPLARKHCHNQKNYESITRYVIYAGHVHIASSNGLVKVCGSFDRTAHGEEHPKGAFLFSIDKANKKFSNEFYHNKNALPYITFNLTKETTSEELHLMVEKVIPNIKIMGSHFRFKGGSPSIVNGFVDRLREQYPYFVFQVDNEVDTAEVDDTLFSSSEYEAIELKKENLSQVLFETSPFDGMSEEEIAYLKEVLKEYR